MQHAQRNKRLKKTIPHDEKRIADQQTGKRAHHASLAARRVMSRIRRCGIRPRRGLATEKRRFVQRPCAADCGRVMLFIYR
ncbi:hypothetical protein GCM10010985_28840 [Caballeronia grimmiae]|uniref:Transposase n=1 Tax=Caballeronia grimmiae TaxID=1071679 RepID=A0ABQ1RJS3_9BURK|nr:hypothetical protein GCM10010985_28840 [Caballeronia grimmiae]